MNREAIFAALFDVWTNAAGPQITTTSRKLLNWADVPLSQRPAAFQAQGDEIAVRMTGFPVRWTLDAKIYVYVSTVGAISPGMVMNPILDAIASAFGDPFFGVPQTLGGLVQWARIEGNIVTSEGTLGDDEISVIPVRILAVE